MHILIAYDLESEMYQYLSIDEAYYLLQKSLISLLQSVSSHSHRSSRRWFYVTRRLPSK